MDTKLEKSILMELLLKNVYVEGTLSNIEQFKADVLKTN